MCDLTSVFEVVVFENNVTVVVDDEVGSVLFTNPCE